jgi:hypothetical protein
VAAGREAAALLERALKTDFKFNAQRRGSRLLVEISRWPTSETQVQIKGTICTSIYADPKNFSLQICLE